ncbi:MAG: excinuclease ABC subunit UvrC [Clostridia bacterium]|nr:excinuclease ABC subunit UvrC [Clostridia bacterium]
MQEYVPLILSEKELLTKAKSLPLLPGVYQFYDRTGKIIYVGKSRALRQRVLSYFQNRGKHSPKTEKMVQTAVDFQTVVTSDEREALLLENEKIKCHQPKFNIRLKDDKDYPYIRLSLGEKYPRLSFARRREKRDEASKYFGPYSSSGAVREVIRSAEKLFMLPTCKRTFPRDIGKFRPCLSYHLGRCVGVCTGKVSPEEYGSRIDEVLSFLKNDHRKLVSALEKEMNDAAEGMEFEKAAALRDRIRALESIGGTAQVVKDLHFHADVFGLYTDELGGAISLLRVREGKIADSTIFHFGADEIIDGESFSSMLVEWYRGSTLLPKKILLPRGLYSEESLAVEEYLSSQGKCTVQLHVPERGEGKALLAMAESNAREATLHRRKMWEKEEEVLFSLADLLQLEVLPERIECIDISHSGASAITAGIITVEKARFSKKDYKSFSLRRDTPDDPDSIREALSRRFARYFSGDESFAPLPDLILVDGGVTQVNGARAALEEHGLAIPVFGMVKDAFHKTRCLTDGKNDIDVMFDGRLFRFLYSIQEEVHRYTLGRMDSRRRKTVRTSTLCDIAGIGEKKAGLLLSHFKSIKRIREADAAALSAVCGISAKDAEEIVNYFKKKKEEKI